MPSTRESRDRKKRPVIYLQLLPMFQRATSSVYDMAYGERLQDLDWVQDF
jgi:hypothetical protein